MGWTYASPGWIDVGPSNGTDDTANIQSAINQAVSGPVRGVRFRGVEYLITSPLLLESTYDITLQGDARATLRWKGNDPTRAVLTMRGCYRCRIQGLTIITKPTLTGGIVSQEFAALCAILVETKVGSPS